VDQLDAVNGIDLNALPIWSFLIERLLNTTIVIKEQTAVLHELNGAILEGRSTLSSIVHHGELAQLGIGRLIDNRDGAIDRVIV